MADRIIVINPNSTAAVTEAIDAALQPWRMAGGPAIECVTLAEGPPGIETQAHVEQVVAPLCRLVRAREDAAAFVIACFSDPGLHAAREATRKPVLGIAECGLLTALTLGERFGIIAILRTSLPRHLRYVRQMGLASRFAGEAPLGLRVVELADETRTMERMVEVGARVGRPRRRRPGARLRRNGAVSARARGRARHAGGRSDPGGGDHGDRPGPAGSRGRRLMRLDGKKALITGAGSYGIGRAVALAFAREGADVAIHYHSRPEVAASVVADIEAKGRRAYSLQADLGEAEVCRQVVRDATEKLGGLDVILTAAAVIYRRSILEISDAEWDHMMALNLRGTFACATEAARIMRANGTKGRIIVIGSIVQQLALAGQIAYGTTKAGVTQLARGMAYELAPDGITVNVIAPGATLTDFNREYLSDPKVRASREAAIPMGRLGDPEDMVEAAVYLASPGAAYTTGITIFVDGGIMLP